MLIIDVIKNKTPLQNIKETLPGDNATKKPKHPQASAEEFDYRSTKDLWNKNIEIGVVIKMRQTSYIFITFITSFMDFKI